ncbi:hypothetical protein LAUMK42_03830 [Mycobacterium persicum]|uniref:Uncharacterized protein n=1 Tax=Mycobacterium persicum TaxID=1487726 RepID=A0AB38UX15_9MYCO|nr:hypothetical protein LAUMK42_03830 [Mycobacterium persicum]
MDAEALLGDFRTVFAGKVFRHSSGDVVAFARVFQPRRVDHHQVCRFDLGRHLGQLECDGLVLGDRLPEGVALLRVSHRQLEGSNGDTTGARRNVHPADFDAVHHLEEALPRDAAEDVVGGCPITVEDEFGGIDALVAQLVDLPGDHQARSHFTETRWLFDEERGQVAVRLGFAFVGAHQHRHQRRTGAVGQPHLLAIDDVVATGIAAGPGANRGDVGAQFRLRHRERAAALAGGHAWQEALLLLVGAMLAQHVSHDEVGVEHTGDTHPAPGQLFDTQRVSQQRLPQPAVFFGDHQTEQAHGAHLVDDCLRIGVGALQFRRVGDDLFVDEFPYGADDFGLQLGQPEGLGKSSHAPLFLSSERSTIARYRRPSVRGAR